MKIFIVGIVGSPTKGGNTEILVRKALSAARDVGKTETKLILLSKAKIAPFTGRGSISVIQDDMQAIIREIERADGIILGSPVYYGSVSAQLKTFMERTLPLWKKLTDKVGAGIVAGDVHFGGHELALNEIRNFFLNHGLIVVSGEPPLWETCGAGLNPGDVRKDKWGMEAASAAGRRVAEIAMILKVDSTRTVTEKR